jgi:O-antigen ligase
MQATEMAARLSHGEGYSRKGLIAGAMVSVFALLDYLMFSVDLKWTFLALGAIALFLLVLLRWPYGALIAVLVASAIPRFTVQIFSWNAKAEHLVAALAAFAILVRVVLCQEPLRLRACDRLLLAFVGMNYVGSSINSPDPKATLRWALLFTLATASYFVLVHLLSDRERVQKAMKIFLIVGAMEAVFGILCYISFRLTGTQLGVTVFSFLEDSPGVHGSLWEPNIFGSYSAAFALMFLFYRLTGAARRGWYTLGFSITALAALLSLARASWIGFLGGFLFLLSYLRARKRVRVRKIAFWVAEVALVILGLVFAATQQYGYLRERLETLSRPTEASTFVHRQFYNALALEQVRDHPFLGWGNSSFTLFWEWDTPEGPGPAWVGNLEVRILHDTGAIGLAIFLAFLVKLLREGVKTLKQIKNQDDLRNIGALLSGWIVLLVAFQATDATTLAFPWVHLGLLAAATRIALEEKRALAVGVTG